MACMTVFAPMAMPTTQLAHVVRYEDSASWWVERSSESAPLNMSWVVVTDENGDRKLTMQWATGG